MQKATELHSALKTDVVGTAETEEMRLALVRLQSSKTDIAYSLHVSPTSFSLSGAQRTDLLAFIGFEHTACPFLNGSAYCREVPEGFDLKGFAEAAAGSYANFRDAERHLEACGLFLPRPEGIGYFFGRQSLPRSRPDSQATGDGHTSPESQLMKESEDAGFRFALTWINGGSDKGWTIHYRPRHHAASPEVQAALSFLNLETFESCPVYDFDACLWRFIPYREDNGGIFGGNAESAHGYFDAHATQFSPGIEKLLAAHAAVERFGFRLLPMPEQAPDRQEEEIRQRVRKPSTPKKAVATDSYQYDVAVSFAGPNRPDAERLATILTEAGYVVFYDDFYPEELWGKNLVDLFDEIYRKRSRYCVIFVSKDYVDRNWTSHERQSAQARRFQEKGSDYILPIQVDASELPGMPPTVGYLPLGRLGIDKIAETLIKKLGH